MNIDEVIAQFEKEHKGAYSKNDRELILSAARSLGLEHFEIRYRNDVKTEDGAPYSTYFYDELNLIHVHPEMIVAKQVFDGATPGLVSKFSTFPHMVKLSKWNASSEVRRPICPHCFIEIPLVGICGNCGFDLEDIDPDTMV